MFIINRVLLTFYSCNIKFEFFTLIWSLLYVTVCRQLNLPQIQKILQEFEKQSEIMDMKEEIMNDAIDDAMEDEGDEEERYLLFLHI